MTLHCPRCGADVLTTRHDSQKKVIVVIFKCIFSATFDDDLSEDEMQKQLDKFESSGKMEEWIKGGELNER